MPIYEYQCAGCDHQFEEWQKISDKPVKKCPSCGKSKVERLLSVSSFQLKGGGWYKDGYGSAKSGGASKSGSASKSSASSGDSSASSGDSGASSKAKDSAGGSKASASSATA